jgi:hypothetical protein
MYENSIQYIHNNLPPDFITSQSNPFHNIPYHLFLTNSILSFSLQLRFTSDLFLSDFVIKVYIHLAHVENASFPSHIP